MHPMTQDCLKMIDVVFQCTRLFLRNAKRVLRLVLPTPESSAVSQTPKLLRFAKLLSFEDQKQFTAFLSIFDIRVFHGISIHWQFCLKTWPCESRDVTRDAWLFTRCGQLQDARTPFQELTQIKRLMMHQTRGLPPRNLPSALSSNAPWCSTPNSPLVVDRDIFYFWGKNPITGKGLVEHPKMSHWKFQGLRKLTPLMRFWCTPFRDLHCWASIIFWGFSNGFHCTDFDQLKVGDFHKPRNYGSMV